MEMACWKRGEVFGGFGDDYTWHRHRVLFRVSVYLVCGLAAVLESEVAACGGISRGPVSAVSSQADRVHFIL